MDTTNETLKTPNDWCRDISFVGLQILEECSDRRVWDIVPVTRKCFMELYLKHTKHQWYMSKI